MTRPQITAAQSEAVIAFEMAHLGMSEHPPGSNHTEPGDWYGLSDAWCAMFQSWAHHSVLGYSPFPASTSKGFAACVAGARWFRRQGAWASGDVQPERGWLIFFIWPGDSIEHHIGKVLGARGPRDVDTIEGNTSDRVQLHRRRGGSIAGYGIIDRIATPDTPHKPSAPQAPTLIHTLGPGMQTDHRIALRDIYAVQYVQDRLNVSLLKRGWAGGYLPGFAGHGNWDGLTSLTLVWVKDRLNEEFARAHKPRPFPVNAAGHANDYVGPKTLSILTLDAAIP